jgi:predicted TIM-barrel fold metal-dependent hydrolase
MTEPRQSWQFGRIYTPDEAWLATAPPEPVLEPDLPIVDPHHHLWQRADHRYLLDEMRADLETGHNVVATVFLECHSMYRAPDWPFDGPPEMRPVGETEFVLSFDAWLYHPQLADVVDLARAFSATPIIMGHVGGVLGYGPYAGKRDEVFAVWKRSMTELARCQNVVVKLGGMVNRGAAFDFHSAAGPPSSATMAEIWRPYVETCIELFGPRRCMFESNFPVDKMAIGYKALWNAFKRIVAGASPDEKRALFAGTASCAYRLADPA